jgi:iron complex outermembrane recepter protein
MHSRIYGHASPLTPPPMTYPTLAGRACTSLACLLLAHVTVSAQTAAPATPAAPRPVTEEVLTLSPFVVSAAQDTGYAATETLAGTRLRTNLRDVASALSVMTPEMLRDLGASTIEEAAIFLPSGDRLAVEQNFGGGNNLTGFNYRFGANRQISIRGVTTQGVSSDFFSTEAPSDFYNSERITVTRGPNSILFGVGGPAGTTLATTKRAQLARPKTQVGLQTDRYGSFRSTLDHNQPIIPGKLAVRMNLLHDARNEFRANEGQWQDRATFSLTLKPFANTTVTALHENWSFDRNYVPLNWWYSNGLLRWLKAGRPTVDFLPNNQAWNTAGRTFVDAAGNRVAVAPGAVDADGFIDAEADFDPNDTFFQDANQTTNYLAGLGLANPFANLRFQPQLRGDTFDGITGGGNPINIFNPPAGLDIPRNANLNPGSKEHPSYEATGRWTQVFVEQKLARDFYLEVAANLGESSNAFSPQQFNSIQIDIAKYNPDGTLNPGYLQPFATVDAQVNSTTVKNQDARATLSYTLDATRWSHWLGRHNFAVLAQQGVSDRTTNIRKIVNRASIGRPGWSTDPISAQSTVKIRHYYVNGAVPEPLIGPKELLAQFEALNALGSLAGGGPTERSPLALDFQGTIAPSIGHLESQSKSFAWQGYWLKDRLVTTFGVRKDKVDTRNAVAVRPDSLSFYIPAADIPLPAAPVSRAGTTRTFAGVVHATSWLSFTYNQSANFQPETSTNTDMLGRNLLNTSGTTKDYGVKLYFMENRLVISANKFINEVLDKNNPATVVNAGYNAITNLLRTNYRDRGDSHFTTFRSGLYPAEAPNVRTYSDTTTEGYELSITYNPTKNWRTSLTGSQNQFTASNLYPDTFEYLYGVNEFSDFTGIATWKRFASELLKVAGGQVSSQFDLDPTNPVHVQQATNDARSITDNIAAAERRFGDAKATEGAVLVQNGEYAANAVVTYSFLEGRLKGLEVGMNSRWRSAPVAHYARFPNPVTGTPEGSIDVTRPLLGDSYLEHGAMIAYKCRFLQKANLRLQLNIDNLFDYDQPLLRSFGTDSLAVYGPQYELVPVRWEMRRPRNYKVSATFDF